MVEFALVSGLFFFLLFGVANAGTFLFARNSIDYAADIGVAAIAAEGQCTSSGGICATNPPNCPTGLPSNSADEIAICRMDRAGLTTTLLVSVSEIDVWKEVQKSGTFVDDSVANQPTTGCVSGGVAVDCVNRYTSTGAVISIAWPPQARNATLGAGGPDFARLQIKYRYSAFVLGTQFNLATSNVFRLEPDS